MTTICTKDGKTLSSESKSISNFILQKQCKKLFKLNDGSVVGISGDAICEDAVIDWLNGGETPKFEDAGFSALQIARGKVYFFDKNFLKTEVGSPYAIGSGGCFAMAAMLAGCTSSEAVKIAIKLDENSGGRIQEMTL